MRSYRRLEESNIVKVGTSELPNHLRIGRKKIEKKNSLKTSQVISEVKKSNIVKGGTSSLSKHLRIKEKIIKLLDPLKTSQVVSEVKKTNL